MSPERCKNCIHYKNECKTWIIQHIREFAHINICCTRYKRNETNTRTEKN